MDMYGFYTGKVFNAYEWLGAHVTEEGVVFRTFAPNAERIDLLWNDKILPMNGVYDGNFYEILVPEAEVRDLYEFRVYHRGGGYTDHCDPYGFGMELRPKHKSVVRDLKSYQFDDKVWMKGRSAMLDKPLNIYELHLGSWRKPSKELGGFLSEQKNKEEKSETNGSKVNNEWYTYDEIAEPLITYLKETGYNYVEFMPLSEHPCDESWGYQNTGFYAPTSRYGDLNGLKKLIDLLHQNQIGAILDFVPVHFAVDEYGLAHFDGSAIYEYPHQDVGVSEWGSYNFMHSRGEVRSFLQSAANYWLKEYHFDGLRMDAISRIIYWQGDERRDVNQNAVDFIKVMNQGLKKLNTGCLLAAEDSTNFKDVTKPADEGGLGFDYKWDMGWMHDTLEYFQAAPDRRTECYHKLTFSMLYYYNEQYILPFSHDEVVHGKATIVQKMNGQYEEKFPQARAMYLYMMVHPGKKLNFMGNEIGQLREWDEKRQQDWTLREYPVHDSFYRFMADLNKLYLKHPAFSRWDYKEEGFRWLDCHQEERCLYAIQRKSEKETLVAVFNFSDKMQENFGIELANAKKVKCLLNTDWQKYGGRMSEKADVHTLHDGKLYCTLMPFSGMLFTVVVDGL